MTTKKEQSTEMLSPLADNAMFEIQQTNYNRYRLILNGVDVSGYVTSFRVEASAEGDYPHIHLSFVSTKMKMEFMNALVTGKVTGSNDTLPST